MSTQKTKFKSMISHLINVKPPVRYTHRLVRGSNLTIPTRGVIRWISIYTCNDDLVDIFVNGSKVLSFMSHYKGPAQHDHTVVVPVNIDDVVSIQCSHPYTALDLGLELDESNYMDTFTKLGLS